MHGRASRVLKWTLLAAGFAVLAQACAAHPSSSSERLARVETSVQDIDGNTYRVVRVGPQRWTGDNLRVTRTAAGEPLETHLPEDSAGNEVAFGRLYDWDNAQRACPAGWRLPSDEDWGVLERRLGAGSQGRWLDEAFWPGARGSPASSDLSGLNARPAGYWNDEGFETHFGSAAVFWTATRADPHLVWSRVITVADPPVRRASQHPQYGLSVRCVASGAD